jgi:hypothetical protein
MSALARLAGGRLRNSECLLISDLVSICQFSDEFDDSRLADGCYTQPVYSEDEVKALVRFEQIWGLLGLLPGHIESIGDFLSSHYWPPFKDEASKALDVFMVRGFFSDEVMEEFDQ